MQSRHVSYPVGPALITAALVAFVAAAMLLVAPGAKASTVGPEAEASNAQPQTTSCARFARAARRSQGAARNRAIRQFRACQARNRNNRIVFSQIVDSRFVGARSDGTPVDLTLCRRGRFESRVTTSSGVGVSEGRRWLVYNARVGAGGQVFVALLRGITNNGDTWTSAIGRRGDRWQVGVESFNRPSMLGQATKTRATDC